MRRLVLLCGFALCSGTSGAGAGTPVDAAAARTLAGANNAFALDLYAGLRAREGSLFFSPYSISSALAMMSSGRARRFTIMGVVLSLAAIVFSGTRGAWVGIIVSAAVFVWLGWRKQGSITFSRRQLMMALAAAGIHARPTTAGEEGRRTPGPRDRRNPSTVCSRSPGSSPQERRARARP